MVDVFKSRYLYGGYSNQDVEDGKLQAPNKRRALDASGDGGTDSSRARPGVVTRHCAMCPKQEEYEVNGRAVFTCGNERFMSASRRSLEVDGDGQQLMKRVRMADDVMTTSRNTTTTPSSDNVHQGTGWHDVKVETLL